MLFVQFQHFVLFQRAENAVFGKIGQNWRPVTPSLPDLRVLNSNMILVLHHIALGLQNFHFFVSTVQCSRLPFFFKVKMGILAYIVHLDSQASYTPYFKDAEFRCGIRFFSHGLHSQLWANGSLNSN